MKKHFKMSTKRQLDRIELKLDSARGSAVAELQAEYDDIVAEDCPLCGDMIIDTIDEPFIPLDEQASFMESWSLNREE